VARACGYAYPFLAYRLSGIGYSAASSGAVLAAFGLGWLIGQPVAGWWTDRFGYRHALLATSLLGAALLPVLACGTGLLWLLCASMAAGFAYDAPRPAVSAAIIHLVPDPKMRVIVSGWRLGAINVGAAGAGGIGGLLADQVGYVALVAANAVSFIAFAAIVVPALPRPAVSRMRPSRLSTPSPRVLRDGRLWLLCLSTLLAMTCAVGLMSSLPLMMSRSGLSAGDYGITQIVDGLAVVVLTPLANRVTSRWAGKPRPLLRAQALSSLSLGAGMGCTGLMHSTLGYSLAVACSVPGEIALYVVATELVTLLSPPGAVGRYHGVFGATFASAIILAPLLTGWALSAGGAETAGISTLACGTAGALLCLPLRAAFTSHRPAPANAIV
jgi:MFS family permease